MRGIIEQNRDPGRSISLHAAGAPPLESPWRRETPPEDVRLRVEVKDVSGRYRLPFDVILRAGIWSHADRKNALSIRVVLWRRV